MILIMNGDLTEKSKSDVTTMISTCDVICETSQWSTIADKP